MNGTIKESKVDVLVIGAGPAGLMASNALSQAGVDFRVVDLRCVVNSPRGAPLLTEY